MGDGQTDFELVYTIAEAAGLLKVSERSIWNLLRRRELARVKIAGRTRIPAASIELFLRRKIRRWELDGGFGQSAFGEV